MSRRPSAFEKKFAKLQFGYKQRTDLYNQLIALISTGMSTTDALQMSWDVASFEGKKPKELTAVVLTEIIRSMKDGNSFAKSIAPWVPTEDSMVFEAIENSDDFVGNLKDYMVMLEKKKKIKGTILGGLAYPTMLFAMVYGIMTYFGNTVVPQISQLLPMDQWQGAAKFLLFMYRFSESYALPGVIVIIGLVALFLFVLPRWKGETRIFADKLPLFGTYRMYTGISFLMSMASLIQGGMPTVAALNTLGPAANPYVKYRINRVRNKMLDGANFGAALHRAGTGWPDPKMNLNIKIFAETQDLSSQLSSLAKNWVDVSQATIARNMGLLRTVAMLAVFLTIMGIVGGIYALQDQIATQVGT